MHVPNPHAEPTVISGQLFRHFLGESCHQDPLILFGAPANFFKEVVNLTMCFPDLDFRIGKPSGPDHLLGNHTLGTIQLVGTGRRRNINRLLHKPLEFTEGQWPVIER